MKSTDTESTDNRLMFFEDKDLTLPRGEKLVAYSTVATIRTMEVKMRDSIFSRTQLVNSLN